MWSILDHRLWFPDPALALSSGPLSGLVAVGGDLTVPRLLLAYRRGIFPWSVNPITWWSPDPRGILPLDGFHVSRSLGKTLQKGSFQITIDRAFQAVMEACAAPAPGRGSTWISPEFIAAYGELHRAGNAHSVECWRGDDLVGGVYGVQIGGFFSGESMFHRVPNASKVALYHLVSHLKARDWALLDVQMTTPHTQQLGAQMIARNDYLRLLAAAVALPCQF